MSIPPPLSLFFVAYPIAKTRENEREKREGEKSERARERGD
jgi:hypothetical protein